MLTYTAAQLKVLDFDDPPPRPVRNFVGHCLRFICGDVRALEA